MTTTHHRSAHASRWNVQGYAITRTNGDLVAYAHTKAVADLIIDALNKAAAESETL